MFTVKRTRSAALSSTDRLPPAKQETLKTAGFTRLTGEQQKRDGTFTSESSAQSVRMTNNTTLNANAITVDLDPMMTGIVWDNEHQLYPIFRDMYVNDAVSGCAADLMSSIPFSNFSLSGIVGDKNSKKAMDTYHECLDRLNIRSMLPEVALDYLVMGSHTSSLLYNRDKKLFTDVMPHNVEDLDILPLPFYSQDPIITVKFPEDVQKAMSHPSKRIERIKEHLGRSVVESITAGNLELDPLTTIYIPRRSFTKSDRGSSYFRRVVPYYLIEKNLYRGTLVESSRRQRGILHATLGDGESWIPTSADMDFVSELLSNADADPLGSVIVTRSGIQIDEFRQGGDFWKVTDFADTVLSYKMRALQMSEGLLSGEASFNTADNALSIFIDQARTFREMITRKFLYQKLFPLISLVNGYTLNSRGMLVMQPDLMGTMNSEEALFNLNDGTKLFCPKVVYDKQLKPEGDTAYIDMLNTMTDKGVPVPLRILAAAGGINLEDILAQKSEDLDVRKRVKEYMDDLAKLNPPPAEDAESSDIRDAMQSSSKMAALASEARNISSVRARSGIINPLDRDYGNASELVGRTRTGKPKHILNQSAANKRINELIAKSAARRRW